MWWIQWKLMIFEFCYYFVNISLTKACIFIKFESCWKDSNELPKLCLMSTAKRTEIVKSAHTINLSLGIYAYCVCVLAGMFMTAFVVYHSYLMGLSFFIKIPAFVAEIFAKWYWLSKSLIFIIFSTFHSNRPRKVFNDG